MQLIKCCKVISAVAVVVSLLSSSQAYAEYSFTVHNTTKSRITKLQVSEDGKTWGYFDIGKGIGPGKKMTLEWDESTNNEGCKQYVKASFADGSESPRAKFDFCENDLEIEF